jgi:hypothetical protein
VKAELVKWRRLVLLVTVPGVALFSLPWIPGKYKIMLALPGSTTRTFMKTRKLK